MSTMFAEKPTGVKRNAGSVSPYANVLRVFSEQSEAERPFVPMVGGQRLFMLLLYASVLVAASIEFFASQRTWYGSWWIYNAYVLVVTSVFVFLGMVMLITSARRGPDDYSLPIPRLLLATLGFVLLSLSGLALVYWNKSLGAWAIPLSVALLYGFLMMVLASEKVNQHDALSLILYGTGLVLMILVPVHEAFNVARTPPDIPFFLLTLTNLLLFTSGMVVALVGVQLLQTRDGFLGAWLVGAMAIFLVSFHEQIGILQTHTYSQYDRTLALIGITFSLVPLVMYIWRERVYIFLWRRLKSANSAIESGDYRGSLKQSDAAIRQCSRVGIEDRFALPWSLKADALYRMKDYQKALVHYDTALNIDPKDSVSWCHVGNMHAFEGRQEQAMKAYDEAIKADPRNAIAWNNKGALYQSLGMNEDALICFDRAITIDPNFYDAHINMAKLFSKMGHTVDSLEHYRIAADLKPESDLAKQGLQKEFYRNMCLDQINGWEQLGLDTSYLRSMLAEDPTHFAMKTKEFLAGIVDEKTQLTVQPGIEHIDVNKAIKTILKVTEGEGATLDQISEATNLKRRELILPLALLIETDHLHFRTVRGNQVYVSKGKAPEKPPELIRFMEQIVQEPIEEPFEKPIEQIVEKPVVQPVPQPVAQRLETPAPEPSPEPAPVPLPRPEPKPIEQTVVIPEIRPSPGSDPLARVIARSKERRARMREEKSKKAQKPQKRAPLPPPPPPEKPALVHREVVRVEPTASILVFTKKKKKR